MFDTHLTLTKGSKIEIKSGKIPENGYNTTMKMVFSH